MNLVPGTFVERYRVEAEIGRGGMARVYRVRHKNLDTVHALKVLTLAGEELAERFMREGKVQSRLDHPNIVPVRDVLEIGQGFGLLMDFVDGPSLDAWMIEHHPEQAERERVFVEILAGMEFAHSKGIVHRDLKPGNVLMELRGKVWHPRIADFGLAKIIGGEDGDESQSRTGRPMGTPAYMSPEQVRCSKHVDHRTDIFALGCILYELMCDRRAFTGEDTLEVFNRVTQGRFRAPRELVQGLPPRIEVAMLGALQIEVEDRIPNCATLYQVFQGEQAWATTKSDNATMFGMDFEADEPEPVQPQPEPDPTAAALTPTPPPADQASQTVNFQGSITFHPSDVETAPPPRRARWALGLGLLVLVFLCFGGWALLWFPWAGTSPEIAEQDATPAPAHQDTESPAPAHTAEPEEPSPASVEPAPEPAEPMEPAPEPVEPLVAPVRAPRPPPAPPSRSAKVRFTGDARTAQLRDSDGRRFDAGEVPPGSYLIEAAFDPGPPLHAGNIVVRAGDSLSLDCRSSTLSCSP